MRLIDADALPISVAWMEQGSKQEHCAFVFERDIKDAPTVDAARVVHGHWIMEYDPRTSWYRVTCSACKEDVTSEAYVIGFFPNAKIIWDFCPYCGANMDEVTE